MHDCLETDLTFFETARHRWVQAVDLRCSGEQLFDAFEDPAAWPDFTPAIRRVDWTSPRPFGVGTTRTVHMVGGLVADERFVAWERGQHMAFVFTRFSHAMVRAFGEDYRVAPLDGGGCRLTWTMAMEVTGIHNVTLPLAWPWMKLGLHQALRAMKRRAEHPST